MIFSVSLFTGSALAADGDWKDLIEATKEIEGMKNIKLTATAIGSIPRDELIFDSTVLKKIVAGHAWLDLDDDDGDGKISGFITSSHDIIGIDSKEQKTNKTHTHTIKARPHPNVNAPEAYCLAFSDIGETQSAISVISVEKKTIKVNTSFENTGIDPDSLDTATSYTIWDPQVNTGRCVDGELLLKLNGVLRGTTVPITSP